MSDPSLWHQAVVSSLSGLFAGAAVIVTGVLFFRSQEQVRREEETQGELAKLLQGAIIECVKILGDQIDAQFEYVSLKGPEIPESARTEAETNAHRASRMFWKVLLRNQFLLPEEIGQALLQANTDVFDATSSDEINVATGRLALVLDPYLPQLRRPSATGPGRQELTSARGSQRPGEGQAP